MNTLTSALDADFPATAHTQDDASLGHAGNTESSESSVELGGQLIEAWGNDLAAAASGHSLDIDMENARLRLHDVQTALVSLGYGLDDAADPVEHIEQGDSRALSEAIRVFQDDNDLETTGRIDRDTYETVMRNYEQALGVVDHGAPEDDFHFLHTSESIAHGADAVDEEILADEALDDEMQGLLNLPDDPEAAIDPQELENL